MEERERLNEAKRLLSLLVEAVGLGEGSELGREWEIMGGERGPRMEARRCSAAAQRVQGVVWHSPMWPQPLC